jgi:hypothetical protein
LVSNDAKLSHVLALLKVTFPGMLQDRFFYNFLIIFLKKLAKNTSFRLLWKNFMSDENVFLDVSYKMPLENFSRCLNFFSEKHGKDFIFQDVLHASWKNLYEIKNVSQRVLLDAVRKISHHLAFFPKNRKIPPKKRKKLRKTSSRHLSGNFLLSKCSPKQVL